MSRPESLRPLRDAAPLDAPELALGARILNSVGPLPRSEQRKRRVWSALGRGGATSFGARYRIAQLAFAGVLFAAASSAAVGHLYVRFSEPVASPPAVTPAKPAAAPRRERPLKPVAQGPAVARPEPAAAEAPLPPVKTPVARLRPEAARTPKTTLPSEADARLLLEAMRARRDGDTSRVSKLVDEYRAKHPQGALQEEALILSIESAVARRAPTSTALAREYLRRFPSGRFTAQAQRALDLDAR